MRTLKQYVSEMWSWGFGNFDVSRGSWFGPLLGSLRTFAGSWFHRPAMEGTQVNYDLARSLYRNDNPHYRFGAGFVRPIVDLPVEYMGLPSVSNTGWDAFLNECITDHWAPQLQQAFRDTIRDSKTIVRFRQPRLDNPLFTEQDRQHGRIEILVPESVDLIFDPSDPDLLQSARITHEVKIDVRTAEEMLNNASPRYEIHTVIENITPEQYTFYDETTKNQLPDWKVNNVLGFVPLWPIWNEYAADLGGGQSDIEPVMPFIKAFHDVLTDTLSAHKYHSIPKTTFTLKDIGAFLRNNFPDVLDENGKIKQGAKINWSGKEIFFMSVDEEAGFVEARSVLGDSKTLLEFLIDCICITAEIPRWAILAEKNAIPETDASVQPFEKKIARKRVQFSEIIIMLTKMALVASSRTPLTARVSWPPIRLNDLVSKGQAIQQLVLAFDAAAAHEWIADETVVKILGTLFPEMNPANIEMALAASNVVPAAPPTAPASDTQALPPASQNGKGTKKAAKAALTTGKASGS